MLNQEHFKSEAGFSSLQEYIDHLKVGSRTFSWFSEQSIANRILFRGTYNFRMSPFADEWLIGQRPDGTEFATPLDLANITSSAAVSHLRQRLAIGPVVEEQATEIEQCFDLRLVRNFDRDDSDYIYETAALRSLSGRHFAKARQYSRRLLRDGVSPKRFCERDRESAMQLLARWHDQHPDNTGPLDFAESREAIELACQGLIEGVCLWQGKQMLAFLLCDVSIDDMIVALILKTDRTVQGLADLCYQSFLEAYPHKRYVNNCQDLGIPGLRKRKLAMRPIHVQDKLYVSLMEGE